MAKILIKNVELNGAITDVLIENKNGASGKIIGKVYFSDYLIYNENQVVKEFTGRVIEKSKIEMKIEKS